MAPKNKFSDCGCAYASKRHPYNTRSAAKFNNACNGRCKNTSFSGYEDMDYCDPYDVCEIPTPGIIVKFCCMISGVVGFLFKLVLILVVPALFMLNYDIQRLKAEISTLKSGGDARNEWIKGQTPKGAGKNLFLDAVNRADFALESTGGQIIHVAATQYSNSARSFFGFPLCEGSHGPSNIIQVTHSPGECWAFAGHTATATIELIDYVLIDAVTLEHIPASLSPTGSIDTAPNEFIIFGMAKKNDKKPELLGKFQYDTKGQAVQTFAIKNQKISYKFIKFEVLSNHGNPHFTCVYRLRVHGVLKKTNQK